MLVVCDTPAMLLPLMINPHSSFVIPLPPRRSLLTPKQVCQECLPAIYNRQHKIQRPKQHVNWSTPYPYGTFVQEIRRRPPRQRNGWTRNLNLRIVTIMKTPNQEPSTTILEITSSVPYYVGAGSPHDTPGGVVIYHPWLFSDSA